MASIGIGENLQQLSLSRQDLSQYSSGYLRDTDVSTPDKAFRFLPIGLAYFLAVPLPWHVGSFRQNLAIPETLFWIVIVYPRILRGALRGSRRNPQGTLFLALTSVAICCVYALFVGNIGTAYRLRIQVWAIGAIFAGLGWKAADLSPATAGHSAQARRNGPRGSVPELARLGYRKST
jgi:hypothetical protein